MSGYASWDLQKAIYTALTGDATLMALVSGIHDYVPQDTAFPYVAIGEATAIPFDTKSFDGMEVTLTMHSWAREHGRKKVKDINAEIYRILHNQNITVANQSLILLRFDFEDTLNESDGITYHGVMRFRALLQEV